MDLPGVIRNKIYNFALPTDGVIELWLDGYMDALDLPTREDKLYQYRTVITKQLKLLRVSKQVNTEATRLFYGTNQWRFSGMHGIQVLASFLLTIGPTSASYLRKVRV